MDIYLFDKTQNFQCICPGSIITSAYYTEEINTAGQLTFSIPVEKRLSSNIFYACINDPDDSGSFLMFKLIKENVTDTTADYTAIESAYDELASYTFIKDKRPTMNAHDTANLVLEGTRWGLGDCPTTDAARLNFYYVSILEALQTIVNQWNLEVQFQVKLDGTTNQIKQRNVNMYQKLGKRTNKRFEYGSNLLSVKQENDSTGLYTALVGRGKGVQTTNTDGSTNPDDTDPQGYGRRITFDDVEWSTANGNPLNKPKGQLYLEDPQATANYGFPDGHPRIGFVVFENCEDPNELIQLTYNKLLEVERPQVQFSASIANVGTLDLGDTIAIIRHDIGIEYTTRVFKVVHNLLNSALNTVELGDDLSAKNSITQQISNIQSNQTEVNNAIDTIVMQGANGNKLYFGTEFPANATNGDVFYKNLENGGTEMYIYDNGWQLVVSTEQLDTIQKTVDEQTSQIQQAVDSANSAVSKADEAVSKAESTKSDLQSTVQELQGVSNDLNTVKQQAISQGRTIVDIQKSTMDLGTQMADVQGNVSSLQQTTQSLQSSVQDNTSNISSVKQTATQLSSTIANLQSAGENLIINSTFSQGSYHWNMNDYQISQDVLFMNSKGVSITQSGRTSPNWKAISITDKIPVSQGQTISFGCWVKAAGIDATGDGHKGAQIGINWYADKNSGRNHWHDTYQELGNHDWVYLKYENAKVPTDSNFVQFNMYLTQNGTAQFVLPLMVFGSTLPSWSPSPLDSATTTDMSSVKQTVSSLQSTVQSNTGDISQLKQTANSLQSNIQSKADVSQVTQLSNVIQSTVQSIGTIFPNGEFDDLNGRNYWLPWDTSTNYSRVNFKQGGPNGINGYMQFVPQNGETVKMITAQYIPVTPNSDVNFSCQSFVNWGNNSKPTQFKAYIHFYDANKSETSAGNIDLKCDAKSKWYQNSASWQAENNECYVRIEIVVTGNKSCYASTTDFKVTSGDNDSVMSKISQLSNDINLRVQKGDLLSQINIEAGQTLIQSDKLYLDASSVIFSGNAFIPSAAITDLSADKITTGTLNAANVNIINLNVANLVGDTTSFVQSAWHTAYGSNVNIDGDSMDITYGDFATHFNTGGVSFNESGEDLGGFTVMGINGAPANIQGLTMNLGANAEFLAFSVKDYGNVNQNPIPPKLMWMRQLSNTYGFQAGWNFLDDVWVDKLHPHNLTYDGYTISFAKYNDGSLALISGNGSGFYWSADGNDAGIIQNHTFHSFKGVSIPTYINSDGKVQSWQNW